MGRGRGQPRKTVFPSTDRRTSATTQRDSDDASLNIPGIVSVSVSTDDNTHDDPGEAQPILQPTPIPAMTSSDSPSATTQQLWVDAVSGN
jgi:hypothetical protein